MAENRLTKFWPGLDDREPQATYRAQMLPYAEYDDGSYRFGTTYPQIVPDTWEAIQKMGRAAQSAFGASYAPEDVMPTAQDAGLIAGLAMTGGVGAGIAGRSARAVSGRAPAQVEASRLLPSHGVEAGRPLSLPANMAESGPLTARVYRGTDSPNESWVSGNEFWASDNPAVANAYSETEAAMHYPPDINMRPRTIPGDVTFQNPYVIDAKGRSGGSAGGPGLSTVELANMAREAGHDGLVVHNVRDDDPLGTTYAALSRGTVKSPYTGETLFSNAPEAAPGGLLGMGDDDSANQPSSQLDFDILRKLGWLGPLSPPPVENYLQMTSAEHDYAPSRGRTPLPQFNGVGPNLTREMMVAPDWWM